MPEAATSRARRPRDHLAIEWRQQRQRLRRAREQLAIEVGARSHARPGHRGRAGQQAIFHRAPQLFAGRARRHQHEGVGGGQRIERGHDAGQQTPQTGQRRHAEQPRAAGVITAWAPPGLVARARHRGRRGRGSTASAPRRPPTRPVARGPGRWTPRPTAATKTPAPPSPTRCGRGHAPAPGPRAA